MYVCSVSASETVCEEGMAAGKQEDRNVTKIMKLRVITDIEIIMKVV